MRYDEVYAQQPGYCRWALAVPQPSGALRQFVTWLRRQPPAGQARRGLLSSDSEESAGLSASDSDGDPSEHSEEPRSLRDVMRLAGLEAFWHEDDDEEEDGDGELRVQDLLLDEEGGEAASGCPAMRARALLVGRLPRVPFSEALFTGTPHPDSCPICMEEFEAWEPGGREIVLTPCLHVFHAPCLVGWLERRRECPSCRWDVANTGEREVMGKSAPAEVPGADPEAVAALARCGPISIPDSDESQA